jgi:GMP synthase-like glutamine amidotransferase
VRRPGAPPPGLAGAPAAPQAVFDLGVLVLGICYGMQTMAAQLGGRVEPGAVHEFGYAEVRAHGHSALLRDIEDRVNAEGHGLLDVWMSHDDRVVELPPGFKGCIPITWFTSHSGHMVNTVSGAKGLGPGSTQS